MWIWERCEKEKARMTGQRHAWKTAGGGGGVGRKEGEYEKG